MSTIQAALNSTIPLSSPHLYYPVSATIPDYEVNIWSVTALLGVFFGACAMLSTITHYTAKKIQPWRSNGELLSITWFVLSGSIHLIFEGYYTYNFANLGAKQTLLGQLWKEYAFSDSRYLTSNSPVLCVEGMTAVLWGPGCLLVAWLIMKEHPLRYSMQALVSFGELYGCIIYFATAAFDHVVLGVTYSRPETFYFWFYFIFMNAIWILIPGVLIIQSCAKHACAIADIQAKGKETLRDKGPLGLKL